MICERAVAKDCNAQRLKFFVPSAEYAPAGIPPIGQSMLRDLFQFLPRNAGSATAVMATLGAIAGLVLWLAGARFSRTLMALVAVAAGAAIGSALPRWCGWSISGMGPAVGLAVVLGISGFVLHRVWVGMGLGAVLALWASLAVWLLTRGGQSFDWPNPDRYASLIVWLRAVWLNVPPESARVIPYAAAAAAVSGLAMTILWPRFSTLLAWSLIGVSMLVGLGSAMLDAVQPQWISAVPSQTWAQCMTLGLLIVVGLVVQWRTGALSTSGADGGPNKKPAKGKNENVRDGAD
jgi:hypothetical protein